MDQRIVRTRDVGRWAVTAGLGIWLGAAAPPLAAAQKTDVVVLFNGDRITGEIKQLSAGKLEYLTDDAGRIYVEWDKVARITSTNYYEVELINGRKHYGRLEAPAEDFQVVVTRETADTVSTREIVAIVPISSEFVDRLKAYLDLGFTLAKANKATTFNLSSEVQYRSPTVGAALTFSSYAQGETGSSTTTRNTVQLSGARFLPHHWRAGGLAQFDQNDELGLAFRLTAGAEAGRLTLTNTSEFGWGGGLVVTRERFNIVDTAGTTVNEKSNLEGILSLQWDVFRYDRPKLDFSTEANAYPSISTPGRLRLAYTGRIKYEVWKDFFAGINFTDNFDSRPPEGAERNDYVLTFTIGWSYRR